MNISLFYITTKNYEEATKIGKVLVEEHIAAGVNILDGIKSIYRWKDTVHNESETILLAKTKRSLGQALIKKVKMLHSYECPCIVEIPVLSGNNDFINWVCSETEYT